VSGNNSPHRAAGKRNYDDRGLASQEFS